MNIHRKFYNYHLLTEDPVNLVLIGTICSPLKLTASRFTNARLISHRHDTLMYKSRMNLSSRRVEVNGFNRVIEETISRLPISFRRRGRVLAIDIIHGRMNVDNKPGLIDGVQGTHGQSYTSLLLSDVCAPFPRVAGGTTSI